MDDDFNTALALGHLFDAVRLLNRILEQPESSAPPCLAFLAARQADLLAAGRPPHPAPGRPRGHGDVAGAKPGT